MYFYNLEGTMIVKYKVKLDYKRLKELKFKIIDNCSLIEHKKEESPSAIIRLNSAHMKNYKSEKINTKDEDIYSISYDLYYPPHLVELINELLKQNFSIIPEIIDYKEYFDIDYSIIKDRYYELLNELYDPDYVKIYKDPNPKPENPNRREMLKELEQMLTDYQNKIEENSKKTKLDEYRIKVLNCMRLQKVKQYPIAVLSELYDFFDESTEKTVNKTLNKILNKQLIKDEKEEY